MHGNAKAERLRGLLSGPLHDQRYTHVYAAWGRLGEEPHGRLFLTAPGQERLAYFDLASLTKALVTTPVCFRALELSGATVATSLGDWLPARARASYPAAILACTFSELLGHRSGLPDWRNLWSHCQTGPCCTQAGGDGRQWLRQRLQMIANEGFDPAKPFLYSDVGFWILGLCLEDYYGKRLDEVFYDFCANELFSGPYQGKPAPLLFAGALPEEGRQAIPTAYCAIRDRRLQGQVHDENAAALGGVAGHAGVFAQGDDVVAYLNTLASSPVGQQMLSANAELRRPGFDGALLGWRQAGSPEASAYVLGQGRAMGHLGFTGTSLWLVPESKVYGVLLTNRVYSGRLGSWITPFRKEAYALLHELMNE